MRLIPVKTKIKSEVTGEDELVRTVIDLDRVVFLSETEENEIVICKIGDIEIEVYGISYIEFVRQWFGGIRTDQEAVMHRYLDGLRDGQNGKKEKGLQGEVRPFQVDKPEECPDCGMDLHKIDGVMKCGFCGRVEK